MSGPDPDGRLVLRGVLQTRLGMPSRVEIWHGRDVIGWITAAGPYGLIVTAAGGVEAEPRAGVAVRLRFTPDS